MTRANRLLARVLRAVFAGLRALGPVRASNVGGAIARAIGPHLPVSRIADANLRAALPGLDGPGRRRVIREVWDNLGRTVGELPHLGDLTATPTGPGYELVATDTTIAAARARAICVAGHIGNWEVLLTLARCERIPFAVFYRAAANPAADAVISALRQRAGGAALGQFAKGAVGARKGIAHLRQGGVLGILIDQKTNDGIPVTFFGRPAMTAPAMAALAQRFRLPVIPGRVTRLGPARFRIELAPPIAQPDTGDAGADITALTQAATGQLESWIRERPGDWLWLHRRWPKNDTARRGSIPSGVPPSA